MPQPDDPDDDTPAPSHLAWRNGFVRGLKPGRWLLERFRIDDTLGAGGVGKVFRAHDSVLDKPVALKVFGELSPASIAEIKHEFRSAAALVHPNLVRLHELFCDDNEWFFTMDLVEGPTLSSFLSQQRDPEGIREVFGQLAVALSALHRTRTLHGDLKPTNVLVRAHDECVVLVDFGLARPLGPQKSGELTGTPAYMAPEQAFGEPLTEAADWYSFGVVLYEALTGVLPRGYGSWNQLDALPEDLTDLCKRLLLLDPARRPTGEEVMACIGTARSEPRWSTVPSVGPNVLVDRIDELGQLVEAFDGALQETRVAVVRGPSGIGKTALIQRFLDEARLKGATVLAGKCRESESMGFKVVDGLLDDIAAFASALDTAEAEAILPPTLSALIRLFPSLQQVDVLARRGALPHESLDPTAIRHRAFAEFARLLQSIRRQGPLVVWIDDLQWSDRESALLLGPVLSGPHALPFLFVGSHRGEDKSEAPLIEALQSEEQLGQVLDLTLGPLPPGDSVKLALTLLSAESSDRETRASRIVREAQGHPLFITELAYAANDTGVETEATSLSELIQARVASLDDSARAVLEVTAVAGVPLARSVLRRACDLDTAGLEEGLGVLRAARLAKSRGSLHAGKVDVHHDRIRELVVQDIQQGRQRECHLRIANEVEREGHSKPDFLAHHFEAAGEREKASALFVVAADRAFKALAFAHAAVLYAKAERISLLESAERRRVALRKAEALAYAGKGEAAADAYLEAAKTARPSDSREYVRRAAEQLLLCGRLERGFSLIRRVLEELGMDPPKSGRRLVASLLAGRLRVRTRGFRFHTRSEREVSEQELAKIDASWTLACSLSVLDLFVGAEFQSRHLLLALRAGEPKRLLRALTLEAAYTATPGIGSAQRTAELLDVAERLASGHADPAASGFVQLTRGVATYLQGRTQRALEYLEEALFIFKHRCSGAVWETVTTHRFAIASSFFLGRFKSLAESVPTLSQEAESTGNVYAATCFQAGYGTIAWLALDRVEEARKQLARTRRHWDAPGFNLIDYNLLVSDTLCDSYSGDARRAHARLVQQWPLLSGARLLAVAVVRVQLWHFRASTAIAAARQCEAQGAHSQAAALRREARHFVRRLRRDSTARAAPLAALVQAHLDHVGRASSAQLQLQTSVRLFEEQGMALYAAAARLNLGRLLGGEEGTALVATGAKAFSTEGIRNVECTLAALGAAWD